MMNYEDFKKTVEEQFMGYMPERYQDMQLRIEEIKKINSSKDGLTLFREGCNVSPTLYLNDMYESYVDSNGDWKYVLQNTADVMTRSLDEHPEFNLDFEHAGENIIFTLVNTEENLEMLKNVPHREFLDLSIVYRWMVELKEGCGSILIHNELAERLNLSEEEMFKLASENTRRIMGVEVLDMLELVSNFYPEETFQEMSESLPIEERQYIIRNNKGLLALWARR